MSARSAAGPGTYRVALLTSVRLYRDGLARALAGHPQVDMVGAAAVEASSLGVISNLSPDIVLLEATAARVPTIVQGIQHAVPGVKVIAVAVGNDAQDAIACAEAGAAGYVSCDATLEDLVSTIVHVGRGEFPCSPRVAALLALRLSSVVGSSRSSAAVVEVLTSREREVLALIDQGFSNKDIAARLGIGLSTVKNHVHNILDKTGASGRSQAAARARTPAWDGSTVGAGRN